ncbi:MAG: phospholipase D-like domain-containing protein [Gemmatimonadota bacterium]
MATLLLSLLLAAALALLWQYLTRGTAVHTCRTLTDCEPVAIEDPRFLESIKLHTNTTMSRGNQVELLFNGEQTYDRLFEELAGARTLITWQVFWFKPGRLAERVRQVLTERARAGVKVLALFDRVGANGIGDEYLDGLRAAGVEVTVFRPLHWSKLYKFQHRSHMRTVVIDARVGYTGGFGIDDRWMGGGRAPDEWRDTNARCRGPVVDQLQAAFAANWAEATGQLMIGRDLFELDDGQQAGPHEAGVLFAAPSYGSTVAERFFAATIFAARERLYLTNAYFVPDEGLQEVLRQAARRGVDVRVLTPGRNTDRMSTYHAGRPAQQVLLEAGVRIFEYGPGMVHAKTLVADGMWSCVSTINFDNRSMALNDEVALLVRDAAIATELEDAFRADLSFAREVSLEELRARPATDRIKERLSRLVAPVL